MINKASIADKIGLRYTDMEQIVHLFSEYDNVDEAILFGSRAKGNYKQGSDIDIALKGDIDLKLVSHIGYLLNYETMIPYNFDIVSYNNIKNEALIAHINRVGVVLYKKDMLISA